MNNIIPRPKAGHDRWLVSYADFITLLFAFFVVLYAFAEADQKKRSQVSAAIDHAFESLSVASVKSAKVYIASPAFGSPAVITTDASSARRVQADLELVRKDLQKRLDAEIAQQAVSIDLGRDGLVISLREAGFFDSGSAIPRPETTRTLNQIAQSLAGTPYEVRVEGHTDNTPIHNAAFDSNWELSSARAIRIARMLLDRRTIAPQRISAEGYAENRPKASNDTLKGRAQNRRVDLVVMPHTVFPVSTTEAEEKKSAWRKITDP